MYILPPPVIIAGGGRILFVCVRMGDLSQVQAYIGDSTYNGIAV